MKTIARTKEQDDILNMIRTVSVNIPIAVAIGLKESILLIDIIDRASVGETYNGQQWAKVSVDSLYRMYPFIPRSTIARKLQSLCRMNLIDIVSHQGEDQFNHTRLYRVNEVRLSQILNGKEQIR